MNTLNLHNTWTDSNIYAIERKRPQNLTIMENSSKMERNKRKTEETREICETATWNLAKCVANGKEKATKSEKTLKTDKNM